MRPNALTNLRVLDLGRYVAAPYCTMLLADLGAEVIRVERPGGDDDRTIGWTASNDENTVFPGLSRNKRGITLDVRKEAGREILDELIQKCDVVVHNFSPAAASALLLDYPHVAAAKHDIIYTSISSWGALGPYAERPGFDPIAQMASGAAAVTGRAGEPLRAGIPWVDYSTGVFAALGTVMALRHRDLTGKGQEVSCSLIQSALSFTAPVIAEEVLGGRDRPSLGNRVPYVGPCDLYKCRDGQVYVAAATDTMWRSLMRTIGRPDLLEAPDLGSNLERFEHRERIDPYVAAWLATKTVEEAIGILVVARVPCGRLQRPREVLDDIHIRSQQLVSHVDLQHPGLEQVPITAHPILYSLIRPVAPSRGPRVGEHNAEVYGEMLGYSAERLRQLVADRVI